MNSKTETDHRGEIQEGVFDIKNGSFSFYSISLVCFGDLWPFFPARGIYYLQKTNLMFIKRSE